MLDRPISDWIEHIGSSYLDSVDGDVYSRFPFSLLILSAETDTEEGIVVRGMSAQPKCALHLKQLHDCDASIFV